MTDDEIRVLSQHASDLRLAGRLPEAITAYEHLLAVRADLPNSWFNLGWLRRQVGRAQDALEAYDRALALKIECPEEAYLERALAFEQLGRDADARIELEAALALNRTYVPALLNLGNLHEAHGEREEAGNVYRRVLALQSNHALALCRLADVAPPRSRSDAIIARLRVALSHPGTNAHDRVNLGFALGAALDTIGAYDEAFATYASANRMAREKASSLGHSYDRKAHEALIDRTIGAFPRRAPDGNGGEGGSLIFICGLFRSGSTLIEQILNRHPAVETGGELDLVPRLVAGLDRSYPDPARLLSADQIARLRASYLAARRISSHSETALTDKRPDNFLHIGLIKAMFPGARIIHTMRDAIDNCLSLFFLNLDPSMSYASDLEDIVHWYVQYLRLMAHWRSLYPDDIIDVDYDRLVLEPRPVIAATLDRCGIRWDDSVLVQRSGNAVRTASLWQVRQPLYRRSSGRWRNYDRHLGSLRAALDQGAGHATS